VHAEARLSRGHVVHHDLRVGGSKALAPIFSAELYAYFAFAPTDVRDVPDPDTIAQANFSGVTARLEHRSRLRGQSSSEA
jgi:hypothetical protein